MNSRVINFQASERFHMKNVIIFAIQKYRGKKQAPSAATIAR
jgi:hypothetical protein